MKNYYMFKKKGDDFVSTTVSFLLSQKLSLTFMFKTS